MPAGAEELGGLIAEFYSGQADPHAVVEAFRASEVLCPLTAEGALWSAESDGIQWVYAFTTEAALAAFAQQRGAGEERWEFARVEGGRLLDLAVPAFDGPAGVAVDIASDLPLMLPPVEGIVPQQAVVRR